jgi:hypothetical protein
VKKPNVKKRRYTGSFWKNKNQSIKESVKSKVTQKQATGTNTQSNTKPANKYVIPSNEEIRQSIKDSVKSKVTQNKSTASSNTQTSVTSNSVTDTKNTIKPDEKSATANTQNNTKPTDKTTTEKTTTSPADTNKAKKSSIWDKTPKSVKWLGEKALKGGIKGGIPVGINWALDSMNGTSSLYYDPATGEYIDTSDMHPIWQNNLAKNNWVYNVPYSIFDKLPEAAGEVINDMLRVEDPESRALISTVVDAGSYLIPYYGLGKGTYDIGNKVVNSVLDTNRDIDMIKDLRYGDLGFSIKYLDDSTFGPDLSPIWEGIKTSLANDWVHDLTGIGRRTGFSEQSDVYKLGQQTTVKMMQKMLEDTDNFDPANAKSRVTLNQFNMMNQLLKNADAYWQLEGIKKTKNMSNDAFYAYLKSAGIDANTYRGMEYAAKQLYNLGDNQERNGLRYDQSIISTQAPMLQYKYARKQKPIKDDPLAGLVGGSHILDGYTKIGDKFINTNPDKDKEPVPEVKAVANIEPIPKFMSSNDPGYIKGDPMTFTKEYNKRHGIRDVTDFYDIWK